MSDQQRVRSHCRAEDGVISAFLLVGAVVLLAVAFVLFQLGHASILRSQASTAAEAAALAGAEALRQEIFEPATPTVSGHRSIWSGVVCSQAADFAARNDASTITCDRGGPTPQDQLTVRVEVLGDDAVILRDTEQPESRGAAQLVIPPLPPPTYGVFWRLQPGAFDIELPFEDVDWDELPPGLVDPPPPPPPEPDEDEDEDGDDGEDDDAPVEEAEEWEGSEAQEAARRAALEDAMPAIRGWAYGLLRDGVRIELIDPS